METIWFNTLPSTQTHLTKQIKDGGLNAPICIAANTQTNGIGSRGNNWESNDGDLFFSFALPVEFLPSDLKIESASIYFMYILKDILSQKGSSCWFKWPNDIYLNDVKIGGAITSYVETKRVFICGIGINLTNHKKYGKCDIKIDKKSLLCEYLSIFTAFPSWGDIFRKFQVEFTKTMNMSAYRNSLKYENNISLNDDGSLSVDNKKVFSLR